LLLECHGRARLAGGGRKGFAGIGN